MRTFHLVLSGHLHAGNVTEYRSPQGRVVVHSSGSLFQGRRPGHLEGYSLIQLGEWCDVYLRRFVPRRGEFIPDIESAPEGGVFRYKLELDADDRRGPRLEAERYGSDA
ncbi:MAG: hypothetical protein ACRDJN_07105 [Chloroflexota bacterium]